jgi:hypothetical protein
MISIWQQKILKNDDKDKFLSFNFFIGLISLQLTDTISLKAETDFKTLTFPYSLLSNSVFAYYQINRHIHC